MGFVRVCRIKFFLCGWQSGEVEGEASEQCVGRCFGSGLQSFELQSLIDECINGMLIACEVDFDRWFESPVFAPGSSGCDPALQPFGLFRREWPAVCIRWWHDFFRVGGTHTSQQFAAGGLTWDDR